MQLNRSTRKKPTFKNSALVPTRRALRSAAALLPILMAALVTQAKAAQTPLAHISLLSTAVDVTTRLKISVTSLSGECPNPSRYNEPIHDPRPRSKIPSALYDFIRACVGPDDPSSTILSITEKASLRSPEYSLSDKTLTFLSSIPEPTPVSNFLLAYSHPLDVPTFKRLLTCTLNSAKSSKPHSPHRWLAFCKVLLTKVPSESLESITSDVLPLTGKTTGVDHRITLYAMLSAVPASDDASMGLAISLPMLMVKETNDIATSIPHTNTSRTPDTSPETKYGRIYRHNELGDVECREALDVFTKAVMGAFEGNLKTGSRTPRELLLALWKGRVSAIVVADDVVSRSTSADILIGTSRKPSFLIWDKGLPKNQRAGGRTVVITRCRARRRQATIRAVLEPKLELGSVFVHLSVHSHSSDVRRKAIQMLEVTASRFPQLLNILLRDALMFSLTRPSVPSKPPASAVTTVSPSGEDQEKPVVDSRRRFAALLSCCANFERQEMGSVEL
ncbi:hypothetical protein BU15DRAFT_78645 [Melanogaster broomeanus]|nr:hypothetical protein BU15DRAFT_78645 [Melanogaster broomeanus]